MKIKVLIFFLVFFTSSLLPAIAQADLVNPPKIQSVLILDAKVFKPGDVIQFKVNYSGGDPGIASMFISAPCLIGPTVYSYGWQKGRSLLEYFNWTQNIDQPEGSVSQIISAVVSHYCTDGKKEVNVYINDETRLSDTSFNATSFIVQGGQLINPGVILPAKTQDSLDLSTIPKQLQFETASRNSFLLPRLSQKGQVMWWFAQGACQIQVPFLLDAGGQLVLSGAGRCNLRASTMPSDVFNYPEIKSNVESDLSSGAGITTFIYQVADGQLVRQTAELKAKQEADAKAAAALKAKQEADAKAAAELKAKEEKDARARAAALATAKKKTTITCVKGKLTKKVTAVRPKCPAGYKVKK